MAYIEIDDLYDLISEEDLVQLTDDDRVGEVNEDLVSGVIAAAESRIENYAGRHYTLPLTADDDVKRMAVVIAAHMVYQRRRGKVPDHIKEQYDEVMTLLKDVSKGKAILPGQAAATTPQDNVSRAEVTKDDRVFTKDTLKGFG